MSGVTINLTLSWEKLELAMSTMADLTAAVTAHTQALGGLSSAVTSLEQTVATLRTSGGLSTNDQAALDAAVAAVTQSTADVTAETTAAQGAASGAAAGGTAAGGTTIAPAAPADTGTAGTATVAPADTGTTGTGTTSA